MVGGVVRTANPSGVRTRSHYTVKLLTRKSDMDLHAHGLRIVERPVASFLPIERAGCIELGGGPVCTEAKFASNSRRAADLRRSWHKLVNPLARPNEEMVDAAY